MEVEITATVHDDEWKRALEALKLRIDVATRLGVQDGLSVIERHTRDALFAKSHPPRTPTPSHPGEPPAAITGQLARSVRSTQVRRKGDHGWTGTVAPHTVYARIQELGGVTGRGHRTHLPPRPYLNPTRLRYAHEVRRMIILRWRAVIESSGR